MIKLKINNKSGWLATTWQDVTIKQAINLMAIPIPDKVTEITDVSLWTRYGVAYAAQVFRALSDFTQQQIEQTNAADIVAYFNRYLLPFIVDLHSQQPESYEPTGIEHFTYNKQRYELPKSLKIESQNIPNASTDAVTFVESSNVMSIIADLQADGIKHLPLFVAIYCRPDQEPYNEAVVSERAKEFENLPMSVAWEVFFCIQQLTLAYTTNILKYTRKQMQRQLMLLRLRAWIAAAIPSGCIRLRNRVLLGI